MNPSLSSVSRNLSLPSDQDQSGRQLGIEELEALREVLESGTLTSTKGNWVKLFERTFAERLESRFAHACSSGTAALHTAIAAIDPEPGDEIITTSITDMGAITPILYQGAIPVFADVDPRTYNVTAETIERCLSPRTRGIMVTHLFGNPCELRPIQELAEGRGIPLIEDCAQSFLASYRGRFVGTWGALGCFSLQQGKHITTGEGGIVVANDEALARRAFLFINKAWGYGDAQPDHYFLSLNYRMNELTGAVAAAQMDKLDYSVSHRIAMAEMLSELLRDLPGVGLPAPVPGGVHTYWKYCLDIDPAILEGGTDRMGKLLRERGVFSAPRYIQKPAFRCQVLRDQCTFGKSRFPFTLARPEAVDYSESLFPGTFEALSRILVLPWNERYTPEHVQGLADCIRDTATQLLRS
ncbi:MAG TPA: DegT/DnrJ/EryC1/StrS family aminotransferase [Pirellulaceae bacterium]